jgi:predicted RNA-binding Zn-ribbon protein involved in translation (DUF1610 family)
VATELVIKSWCDVCAETGKQVEGESLTVAAGEVPPFDIELCPKHAKPLAEAVTALAPLGRPVGTGVPKVPGKAPRKQARADMPNRVSCPECGEVRPSLASMRAHLHEHGKSLADVGLAEARHACPDCGSMYPNRQGLAAHSRTAHGQRKQSA